MDRYLSWLRLLMAAAFPLAGCHYTEEQSWSICCTTMIVGDETASPPGRQTIIGWVRRTGFSGTGKADEWVNSSLPPFYSWKKNKIASDLADYLAGNPGNPASAFFVSLGMTCRRKAATNDDVTRCDVELPTWVECLSMNIYFPGGPPVPEELRKPLPAVLHVSVDVSASAFLDTSARLQPIPGGRLCHR
jgi:hypothetical protein